MKVLIEAMSTPNVWRLGGTTAKLRIYANQSFKTSLGQWVPQGTPGHTDTFFLEVDCTIADGELTIPGIEVDSTVDALVNPFATYTAEIVSERNKRIPFLAHFSLNTLPDGDPSTTWGEIQITNEGYNPQSISEPLIRQLISYVQLAVGDLNRASETNTGVTALTTDPIDPVFPIAVSASDPNWLAVAGGVDPIGVNALSNGVVNDAVIIEDATISLLTPNTLSSPASAFTAALAGKVIAVPGAGPGGATLKTTIAAVPDPTSLTLTDAATTAVAATRTVYGTDNTAALQALLNSVTIGTGPRVVILPKGNYLFSTSSLSIPQGVTLQGSWDIAPDHLGYRYADQPKPMDGKGTTLVVVTGEGNIGNFIAVNSEAALRGVSMFWPANIATLAAPKVYPWAIEMTGSGPVVENVELVNPYFGIYSHIGHRHRVQNVRGTPLAIGLYASQQTETSHYLNVNFTPIYMFAVMPETFPFPMIQLMQWVHQNGTAFKIGKNDNSVFYNCFTFGYFTGFKFVEDPLEVGVTFANGLGAPGGLAWAQFTDCGADACPYPVDIDNVQGDNATGTGGVTFTNCVFTAAQWFAFAGPPLNGLWMRSTCTGRVGLANCRFRLGNRNVVVESGRLDASGCYFQDWAVSAVVLGVGGVTAFSGNHFKQGSPNTVVVITGSPWTSWSGNIFEYIDTNVWANLSSTANFNESGNTYATSPIRTAVTFQNGWVNFDAANYSTASYIKKDGWVTIQGNVKDGVVGLGTPVFTLPVGHRPARNMTFATYNNGAFAGVQVSIGGEVSVLVGTNVATSLDGIRFPIR